MKLSNDYQDRAEFTSADLAWFRAPISGSDNPADDDYEYNLGDAS